MFRWFSRFFKSSDSYHRPLNLAEIEHRQDVIDMMIRDGLHQYTEFGVAGTTVYFLPPPESAQGHSAVDPSAADPGTPSTRDAKSLSSTNLGTTETPTP